MSADCPDQEVLIDFLTGHLSDDTLQVLENHLAQCSACGDTIRALNVEDTYVKLARAAEPLQHQDAVEVDRLIARLRDLSSLEIRPSSFDDGGREHSTPSEDEAENRAAEVRHLLAEPQTPDEIGRLAHYRILKLLGAGGMGAVYQAEDTQLQRIVALKVLRPSLGKAARKRFLLEARAAAAVNDDHVITIYQVGQEESLAYLAMEWLDGVTLEALLAHDAVIPPDEVIKFGRQIAKGLVAAHAKNLIHRDIKPANVWIEADRDRARILDFGLARVVDDSPSLTETGMIAGTPAYMSPEQAQGKPVDERSDLFSLGCVLYRMCTGKLPFQADNALAMLRSIQVDQPPTPDSIEATVPRQLSDLVMRLLEKDVDRRPQSAAELVACLDGEKSLRPLPSESFTKRRRWSTAVAMGFVLVFAAVMIVLEMGKGTLIVESARKVEVRILRGDREYKKMKITKGSESTRIRAGQYQIEIVGDHDELEVRKGQVTLSRGGQWRATIVEKPAPQSSETAKDRRVFDPAKPVKPGDSLVIEHANGPVADLLPRTATVLADDTLRLPHVGIFQTQGKTIDEIQAGLTKAFAGLLREPELIFVTVSPDQANADSDEPPADPRKPLQPGDILHVEYPDVDVLTRDVTVLADHTIRFPFVGSYQVKGLTIDDLQQRLNKIFVGEREMVTEPLFLLTFVRQRAAASADGNMAETPQVNPATIAELERLSELAQTELELIRTRHEQGATTLTDLITGEINTLYARIRLASARGARDEARGLVDELTRAHERRIEAVTAQYREGVATSQQIFAAQRDLAEFRIWLNNMNLNSK